MRRLAFAGLIRCSACRPKGQEERRRTECVCGRGGACAGAQGGRSGGPEPADLLAFCMAERNRIVAHQTVAIGVNFESEKPHALRLLPPIALTPASSRRPGGQVPDGDLRDQPLQRAAHRGVRQGDGEGVRRSRGDRAQGRGRRRAPARVRPARIIHRSAALCGCTVAQAGVAGPRSCDAGLEAARIVRAIAQGVPVAARSSDRRSPLYPRSAITDALSDGAD